MHQLPQAAARATPWTTALCESLLNIACYGPDQIRAAYNEAPLFKKGITGKGADDRDRRLLRLPHDPGRPEHVRRAVRLPRPAVVQDHRAGRGDPHVGPEQLDMTGWAGETTLDVEYAHTIAPGANILLVETPTAETEGVTGFPEIVKAEKYVVDHHLGDVISQSFGATEETFTSFAQLAPLRAAYEDAFLHGVTVLAATGDDGATNAELDGSTLYTTPDHRLAVHRPAGDGGRRHAAEGERGRHVLVGRVERHVQRPAAGGVHRHGRPEPLRYRRRRVRVLQAAALPERRGARDAARCAGCRTSR